MIYFLSSIPDNFLGRNAWLEKSTISRNPTQSTVCMTIFYHSNYCSKSTFLVILFKGTLPGVRAEEVLSQAANVSTPVAIVCRDQQDLNKIRGTWKKKSAFRADAKIYSFCACVLAKQPPLSSTYFCATVCVVRVFI